MDALWKFGEHERSVRVARGLFDPFCWLKKRHNQLSDGCWARTLKLVSKIVKKFALNNENVGKQSHNTQSKCRQTQSKYSSFSKHLSLVKVEFGLFRMMFTLPTLSLREFEAKLDRNLATKMKLLMSCYIRTAVRILLFHERALAMVDSQRGVRRVGYNYLISNKREWNNCFIKNAPQI